MSISSKIATTATAALALAVLGTAAGPPTSTADVRRHRVPARVRCDIPERDYVAARAPRLALATSFRAVLTRIPVATLAGVGPLPVYVPVAGLPAPKARADFALTTARVGVDQCSIAGARLALWDNGYWSLSFRADQNLGGPNRVVEVLPGASVPLRTPVILPGSSGPTLATAYIKRNLFTVKVRGLGAFAADPDPEAGVDTGHPVLFEFAPDPFWVQNGVPLFRSYQGTDPRVAAFFAEVDRVMVEVSYR